MKVKAIVNYVLMLIGIASIGVVAVITIDYYNVGLEVATVCIIIFGIYYGIGEYKDWKNGVPTDTEM